jgi:hypothetical protein
VKRYATEEHVNQLDFKKKSLVKQSSVVADQKKPSNSNEEEKNDSFQKPKHP